MLTKSLLHFCAVVAWLSGIHFVFATWLALFKKGRSDGHGIVLFLLSLGLTGYAVFWLTFFSPVVGTVVSALVLAASLPITYRLMTDDKGKAALKRALALLLPVSAYVLLLIVTGYYPGFFTNPSVASHRWMEMANDNIIPKVFGDQLRSGSIARPMIGDWLSSDRPPLQAGLYLMFLISAKAFYQVLSMVLQSLIFLPLSVLIQQLGQHRLEPFLLIVFGLSSLMVMNAFHVWPKLLATVYLLIVMLLTLTSFGDDFSASIWILLVGGSAALALLSHGGSIFSILTIALLAPLRNRQMFILRFFSAFLVLVVLYAPWVYYQKYIDPPGDRLLKWHLAGLIPLHPEMSIWQSLKLAYSGIGLHEWVFGRVANIGVILSGTIDFFVQTLYLFRALFGYGDYSGIKAAMIDGSFHNTVYSFWFLSPWMLMLIFMVRRSHENRLFHHLLFMVGTVILSYLIWVFLMFIPGSTVIHQGSFLPWVLLYVTVGVTVWILSDKLFYILAIMNGIMFLLLYGLPGPHVIEPNHASLDGYVIMLIAALLLFARSCFYQNRITLNTSIDLSSEQ